MNTLQPGGIQQLGTAGTAHPMSRGLWWQMNKIKSVTELVLPPKYCCCPGHGFHLALLDALPCSTHTGAIRDSAAKSPAGGPSRGKAARLCGFSMTARSVLCAQSVNVFKSHLTQSLLPAAGSVPAHVTGGLSSRAPEHPCRESLQLPASSACC